MDTIRSFRFQSPLPEIAIADVIASVVAISLTFIYVADMNVSTALGAGALLTFPLAILVHWLLEVPTELNYQLGISSKPNQ